MHLEHFRDFSVLAGPNVMGPRAMATQGVTR